MRTILLALMISLATVACDDDEAGPAPATEPSTPAVGSAETPSAPPDDPAPAENDEALTQEQGTDDDTSTRDGCPLVVLDPQPPLRVRSGPSSSSDSVGHLDNGTIVHHVERRDGYVRITAPMAGWIYEAMLMRTCDAPPALPAVPLGAHTYLLLPWSDESPQPEPGTPLPAPVMDLEPAAMGFSYRDAQAIETPIPITLVSESGSCERNATRRVLIVGTCPDGDYGDYSSQVNALEVPSCPELHPSEDHPIHITRPMMVGLVGHHQNARLEAWPHSPAPLSPHQRRVMERRIQRAVAAMEPQYRAEYTPEMPESVERFADSTWSWVYLDEVHLLFHGNALVDEVDMTANFPLRVRAGTELLAGVGNWGHHGYGFYMFPNEARRGLARESGYPTFSCSSN